MVPFSCDSILLAIAFPWGVEDIAGDIPMIFMLMNGC